MDINIIGSINKVGFGTHTTNMIKALTQLGHNVAFRSIHQLENIYIPNYIEDCIAKDFNAETPTIYIDHVNHVPKLKRNDIIIFMVFETNKVASHQIKILNSYSKFVITTTNDHKKILIECGVTKDIYVIPEGVDHNLYNTNIVEKLIDTNNYTYILLGKNEKRKNTNKVIASFLETMQYKNVSLICHTFNFNKPNAKQYLDYNVVELGYKLIEDTDTYFKFYNSFSYIYLVKPGLTDDQMKQLYMSANVAIAYSSGEGWGLPPLEAMACGVPTIISNVLGHNAFIKNIPIYDELIVEPIAMQLAKDDLYFNGTMGLWCKLSSTELNRLFNYTYDNEIGLYKSTELSEYYGVTFNWLNASQQLINIL